MYGILRERRVAPLHPVNQGICAVAVLECGSLLPLFCWTACCPISRTQASLVLIEAQASLRSPHLRGGQFDTSVVREHNITTSYPYLWGCRAVEILPRRG